VEFALMVAIFVTWIIVSVAMFQQGVRDVYAGATGGTAAAETSPTRAAPTVTVTTTAAPKTEAPTTEALTTEAPTMEGQAPVPTTTVTMTPPLTVTVTTTAPARTTAPAVEEPEAVVTRTLVPAVPAPTTARPESEAPTRAVPTAVAPTQSAPTAVASTPSAPTTAPAAGPTLALTESVAKKGTLASNLLSGLSPAATLAAVDVTSGRGELAWTMPSGEFLFTAPRGRDTTVITFTYIQNAIPVTGNTLTVSTS
jgi:hypothetical protein